MRLPRPVAIVLMVLVVGLLVWFTLGDGGGGETPTDPSGPTVTQDSPTPQPTVPEPTDTSDPADEPSQEFETFEGRADETDADGTDTDGTAAGLDEQSQDEASGSAYQEESAGPAGTDTRDWDGIDACDDGDLPRELGPVTEDVEAGGPFEYPGKDGSTFFNRERLLPDESRGYYREYTVDTPGSRDRGARRIVTGGGETDPEVWYYTDDHYESFCEFAP